MEVLAHLRVVQQVRVALAQVNNSGDRPAAGQLGALLPASSCRAPSVAPLRRYTQR